MTSFPLLRLLVASLLCAAAALGDARFTFPASGGADLALQKSDRVNITYESDFDSPALTIWCETPVVQKKVISDLPPRNGFVLVEMDFTMNAGQICWFNLRRVYHTDDKVNSGLFTIGNETRQVPVVFGASGNGGVATLAAPTSTGPSPTAATNAGIAPTTTSGTTTPTASPVGGGTSQSGSSDAASPQPEAASSTNNSSLATGVGIGVGCTAGLGLILGILFALYLRNWKKAWIAKHGGGRGDDNTAAGTGSFSGKGGPATSSVHTVGDEETARGGTTSNSPGDAFPSTAASEHHHHQPVYGQVESSQPALVEHAGTPHSAYPVVFAADKPPPSGVHPAFAPPYAEGGNHGAVEMLQPHPAELHSDYSPSQAGELSPRNYEKYGYMS